MKNSLKRNILLEIVGYKVFQMYFNEVLQAADTFTYSKSDIKKHKKYFKICFDSNLSTYKALTFFHFHLIEKHEGQI